MCTNNTFNDDHFTWMFVMVRRITIIRTASSNLSIMTKTIHIAIILSFLPLPLLAKNTFVLSFQSSEIWSKDEWAEYVEKIPIITEFTSCHWEKLSYFAAGINFVWSYCHESSKTDSKLKCVQAYHKGNPSFLSLIHI